MLAPAPILIFPGIGNSGPQHWQTLWEQAHPDFVRIAQRDWDYPVCDEWVAELENTVQRLGPSTIVVAHSLACLTVAHWAAKPHAPIKAALLVAVPDSSGPNFPAEVQGFADTPAQPFPFPSIVVISEDDPYCTPQRAEYLAAAWGSRVVHIGNRGHINASSGLGDWPEGYALLQQLCA